MKKVARNIFFTSSFLFLFVVALPNAAWAKVTEKLVNPCGPVVAYKGLAYFCADHAKYGKELHVSNGDLFGTKVLLDIDPGPGDSSPIGLFELNGNLYFIAENTAIGYGLWESDGTSEGTKLVKSLGSHTKFDFGPSGPHFDIAARKGNAIYFEFGAFLFKTDGTALNTIEIDLPEGLSSFSSYSIFNNQLYVLFNSEFLYRVGDDSSLTKIYEFSNRGLYYLTGFEFNNQMVIGYIAGSGVLTSYGVWISDGTSQGTRRLDSLDSYQVVGAINNKLVLDKGSGGIVAVTNDGNEQALNDISGNVTTSGYYNNKLVIEGFNTTYLTDGTASGTTTFLFGLFTKPIDTVLGRNSYKDLILFDGNLVGYDFNNIYISDGANSGTIKIPRPLQGIGFISNADFVETSKGLVYGSNNRLWLFNKTTNSIRLFADLNVRFNSGRTTLYSEGNRVYLREVIGEVTDSDVSRLWHADGTPTGTYILKYRFEDGTPESEPVPKPIVTPIIQFLLD